MLRHPQDAGDGESVRPWDDDGNDGDPHRLHVHFVWAAQVSSGTVSVAAGEEAFIVLEAVRRLGVGLYLVAITFGLATIVKVLRFQSTRLRELARSFT